MTATDRSIVSNIEAQARARGEQPAILSVDGAAVSCAALFQTLLSAGAVLREHGVERGQRVALALPNGPDAALAFLATACWTASAPLNPSYTAADFEFYFGDLKPALVVVPDPAAASPACDVARRLGLPLAGADELLRSGRTGGTWSRAGGDDVALVLHTSGTTSRPKLVPLTQRNLLASADNIARTLQLTPGDRALNAMPLFHIHGLLGVLLSSLVSGASVVCLPRFEPSEFFGALESLQPTWYSAVPTIHQAVFDRVRSLPAAPKHRLRFIRSSSSALAPQLMAGLEESFGVPVIEAYGMTEASHQMASNPLPPRARKPASVGLPAGPEIAILDPDGAIVAPGVRGEVSIRGENVTGGYENNPEANEKSFTSGWFRTGDEGFFDEDGYLFLTGRLKEMINRGGEKIAPVEVDRVMMDHPAVAQALAFAVPHPRLGEDVGVAVVLRPGATTTPAQLRAFARSRLASFKVPSAVVVVDAIPKGATGKQQRIGLAEKLGVTAAPTGDTPPPATAMETRVAAVWSQLLRVDDPRLGDDFFLAGGDSIVAVQLLSRVQAMFEIELSLERFFASPTLGELASMAEKTLVAKIEAMSDEDASALLAEQDEPAR